jgi:hypothetical protein
MANRELRKLERDAKAATAAGLAGFALAVIGLWAVPEDRSVAIQFAVCGGFVAAIFSPVVGVAGASARSLNHASLIGACIVGIPVAFLNFLFRRAIGDSVWLFAAFCSLGSILAQVGAVAAATATTENRPSPMRQFTIRQSLAFFIPVAIYFGYVTHFTRK